MLIFLSVLLISSTAVWLVFHRSVQRRLRALEHQLPAAYAAEMAICPEDSGMGQLIPLAVDLMRRTPCTDPFDQLSAAEKRIALYAYAIETLPRWQHPTLLRGLRGPERALIDKLRHIRTSRPDHPERHFGAIRAAQQMRTVSKT